MGAIDTTTGGQRNKAKIDLEYLWEKYGKGKKRKPKPEVEEPTYYNQGFSVKFKLSHAYKALEKQEQDVAEPVLESKKALTPKMIKHLAAKHKPTIPPQIQKHTQDAINRGSLQDRVQADLSKYREIGKLKREKTDILLKIAREKETEIPVSVRTKKVYAKCKPTDYWSSLSMRKGTQKDDTQSQDGEYEDRTFLTNANLSNMLKSSSKFVNTKAKKVKIKLDVNQSPRHGLPSETGQGNVQFKEDEKHKLRVGTKAILEWDRRRKQRYEKQIDQKCKIKEAAKFQNQPHLKKQHQGDVKPAHTTSTKHKKRPKSAPSPRTNEGMPDDQSANPLYKTVRSKMSSQWSKCLDAMYLDVPNNFEEPDNVKKPEKDAAKSNDSDEDDGKSNEEDTGPQLQYKPSEYLYGMCDCQNIAKQTTLHKLQKKTKTAGVIQIFGCPGDNKKTSTSCPFCTVFPKRRIKAWLDDVEKHTDPFWNSLQLC